MKPAKRKSKRAKSKPDAPPLTRSQIMARVRGKDTRPEMVVRRLAHGMGYRYRLHRRGLPGSPDLAFGPRRRAIFVHGCFWHGHDCARGARIPKANADYWGPKLRANRERDERQSRALAEAGWDALVVWECELADRDALASRLRAFLGPPGPGAGVGPNG